jgi:hypothetical protein
MPATSKCEVEILPHHVSAPLIIDDIFGSGHDF